MTWSYSRINAFNICPYMFYLTYIKKYKGLASSFGLFGSFCHHILEKYFKGELLVFELYDYYIKNYKKVVNMDFPPNRFTNLNTTYYVAGAKYFHDFNGFYNLKFLDVEHKVNFKINDKKVMGYIDLLAEDENSNLIIVDHKTKKFKSKKEINEYARQLYLYSIPVIEKYNKYPKNLIFNMIRENSTVILDYKKESLDEAKEWVVNTINKISNEDEFKPNVSDFFCDYICGVRNYCNCSNAYLGIDDNQGDVVL